MKKVICAAIGFTLVSSVASAQTQPNTWQGSITIRALTGAGCEGELRVGQIGIAVYRPRIGTSGPSRLQFVFTRAAVNHEKTTAGQMNGSGSYDGTKLGSRAGVSSFSGTFNLNSQPATVAANTPNVTLSGTITNFFDNPDCTATFTAPMTKRPAGGE
jgi:hypothetical protein